MSKPWRVTGWSGDALTDMTAEEARRLVCASFPTLRDSQFEISSPETKRYNCIAWAAGEEQAWWWPGGRYWPDGVPKEDGIEAFMQAYAGLGYAACETDEPEEAVEKVALYADADGRVLHAARQLPDGRWTSKLGEAWDISHELHGLEGDHYGRVARILKRPRTIEAERAAAMQTMAEHPDKKRGI